MTKSKTKKEILTRDDIAIAMAQSPAKLVEEMNKLDGKNYVDAYVKLLPYLFPNIKESAGKESAGKHLAPLEIIVNDPYRPEK